MRPTHLPAHISQLVTLVTASKRFWFCSTDCHFAPINIYLAQYWIWTNLIAQQTAVRSNSQPADFSFVQSIVCGLEGEGPTVSHAIHKATCLADRDRDCIFSCRTVCLWKNFFRRSNDFPPQHTAVCNCRNIAVLGSGPCNQTSNWVHCGVSLDV